MGFDGIVKVGAFGQKSCYSFSEADHCGEFMLVKQSKEYRGAISLDEELLHKINSRFEMFKEYYLSNIAKEHNVEVIQANEILRDPSIATLELRYAFEKYKSFSEVRFDAKWENGKSVKNCSLDELKEILDYESSNPKRLLVEIGTYGSFQVSLDIRSDFFSTAQLVAHAEMRDLPVICENIDNIIVKSAPEFSMLHHAVLAPILSFLFPLLSIIIVTYFNIKARSLSPSYNFIIGFMISMIIFGSSFLYRRIFPTVIFKYGRYNRAKTRISAAVFVLSNIAIPYLVNKLP